MITAEQAIAKVTAEVDAKIAERAIEFEGVLRAHGATETEMEANREWHAGEVAAWREKMLADLREWLARGGEPLQ